MVTVFPVPGGPNTMYGAGREVPFTILVTANCCSLLDSIFASKNLFYIYTNVYNLDKLQKHLKTIQV